MLAMISMLKLLTVFNFGCVYGAFITMDTLVSSLAGQTSGATRTHTLTLEMIRKTQRVSRTGYHRDSYKLIYGHDVAANNEITDDVKISDELSAVEKVRGEVNIVNIVEGLSRMMVIDHLSDENLLSTQLSNNIIGADGPSGLELDWDGGKVMGLPLDSGQSEAKSTVIDDGIFSPTNTDESSESEKGHAEIGHVDIAESIPGNHVESDIAKSSAIRHVEIDSVEPTDYFRSDSIESAESKSADNIGSESVESSDHVGGESVESADHVGSESVESSADESEGPVVRVHGGSVRGLTLDKAHVFYGIPYAGPPVGQQRWLRPQPVLPWLQTYNATFPRPSCMQACAGEFAKMCPPKVRILIANQRGKHCRNAPIKGEHS